MTTVLVTGVGAIIGYGLLRSLRSGRPEVRRVGCDIYADAVGQAWCDYFEQAPLTRDPGYLAWLGRVVKRHRIDLILPGIEQDAHYFSAERARTEALGVRCAVNSARLVECSRDKWHMHQALLEHNDPARIPSYLNGDYETLTECLGLPFILKPRCSYASKGLVRVKGLEDFRPHAGRLGEFLMAQPIIGTDDEEYTVGVFGDGLGNISASIQLKRRLAQDGSTASACVVYDAALEVTVRRLCAHFTPEGPTNLQFRRDQEGFKLLEINPRVSSTSSMRTAFGYDEAAMSLDYYLHGKLPEQPVIKNGFSARYIEDYVVYDRYHF